MPRWNQRTDQKKRDRISRWSQLVDELVGWFVESWWPFGQKCHMWRDGAPGCTRLGAAPGSHSMLRNVGWIAKESVTTKQKDGWFYLS